MARLGSEGFPRVIAGAATLAAYVGVWAGVPLALVLAPALLVGAAAAVGRGRPDEDARAAGRGHAVPAAVSRACRSAWPRRCTRIAGRWRCSCRSWSSSPATRRSTTAGARWAGGRWRRASARRRRSRAPSPASSSRAAGHAVPGPPRHAGRADRAAGRARRADRDHRDHGRPVRVAAEARQRHQGFVEPDPRPRRHPRSHRRAAVRVPGLRAVPAPTRGW